MPIDQIPLEYQTQFNSIDRRRKMAEMLLQQNMQPLQGQMVSGRYVAPGVGEGLAKLAGVLLSSKMANDTDQQQTDLSKRYQQDAADTMQRAQEAMSQPNGALEAAKILSMHPSTMQAGQGLLQKSLNDSRIKALVAGLMGNQSSDQQPGMPGSVPAVDSTGQSLPPQAPQQGISPQPGPQSSSQSPMSNVMGPMGRQILGLTMSEDPGLEKMATILNDRTKPVALREGDLVGYDANGRPMSMYQQPKFDAGIVPTRDANGQVTSASAVPGYANASASIHGAQTGATEAAKAPYQFTEIDLGNGQKVRMTNEQLRQLVTQQSPVDPSMTVSPQVQMQRDAQRLQLLQQEAQSNPNDQNLQKEISITSSRLNAGTPFGGQNPAQQPPVSSIQTPQNGPGVITGQSTSSKSYAEGSGKNAAEYESGLNTRVSQGADLMMRIEESRNAMQQFKAGGGAESRLALAKIAQGIPGVSNDLVDKIAGGNAGAMEEFNKLAVQQAMEQLKQSMGGAGRIAQAEFKVFQANNPNLSTDPRATDKIYDFATKVYNRDSSEQQAFAAFKAAGGDPTAFQPYWQQQLQSRGIVNTKQAGKSSNIDALLKKYGQ